MNRAHLTDAREPNPRPGAPPPVLGKRARMAQQRLVAQQFEQQLRREVDQAQRELLGALDRWVKRRARAGTLSAPIPNHDGPYPGVKYTERSELRAGERLGRLLKLSAHCGLSAPELASIVPALRPVLRGHDDLLAIGPVERLQVLALFCAVHPNPTDRALLVGLGVPPRMRALWRTQQVRPKVTPAATEAWKAPRRGGAAPDGWSSLIQQRTQLLSQSQWELPAPTPEDLSWSLSASAPAGGRSWGERSWNDRDWSARDWSDRTSLRGSEPAPLRAGRPALTARRDAPELQRARLQSERASRNSPDSPAGEPQQPGSQQPGSQQPGISGPPVRPLRRAREAAGEPLSAIKELAQGCGLSPDQLLRRCGLDYRFAARWLSNPAAVGALRSGVQAKLLGGLQEASGLSADELITRLGLSPEDQERWRAEARRREEARGQARADVSSLRAG